MKTTRILSVLVIVLVALGVVMAQDTTESAINGSLTFNSESGTLVALGGDDYVLTVNVLGAGSLFAMTPAISTYRYSAEDLASDWDYAGELSATAVLDWDNSTATFEISKAQYDVESGALVFNATISETFGVESGKRGLELPESFEGNSLFIVLDETFFTSIFTARTERLSTTRNQLQQCLTPKPC